MHLSKDGAPGSPVYLPGGHGKQPSISRNDPISIPNFPALHLVQVSTGTVLFKTFNPSSHLPTGHNSHEIIDSVSETGSIGAD